MRLGPWIERAVKILDEITLEQFVLDPLVALTNNLGLKVGAVESLSTSRDDGGFCDGMSFIQDGVILYASTSNSRRQNFTLAHELGHWIVEHDQGLFDWIADQSDPPALLESVCDQIAQRLLLPDVLTSDVVGSDPVQAHHVNRPGLGGGRVPHVHANTVGYRLEVAQNEAGATLDDPAARLWLWLRLQTQAQPAPRLPSDRLLGALRLSPAPSITQGTKSARNRAAQVRGPS